METFKVALVVFAEVQGLDLRDAANRAEAIVDGALIRDTVTSSQTGAWSVAEVGTAMRNGMLRIGPA